MSARLDRLRAMREWIDAEIAAELRVLGTPIGADSLIARAAELYGVAPSDVICTTRGKPQAAKARQAAAWMLRDRGGMTYPQIAQILGYADHTTVLYACRKIDATPAVRSLIEGCAA